MEQLSRPRTDYEADFAAWAADQARLLRDGLVSQADLGNIAEELEGLSRAERRRLRSCLTLIVMHLLILSYQPERASRSWRSIIQRERTNCERLLEDSPSLRSHLAEIFRQAYADGRERAIAETGLDARTIPVEPVFSLDEVRDRTFLPLNHDGQPTRDDGDDR